MKIPEINSALEAQMKKCSLPQAIRQVSSYLRFFYPDAKASYIYEKIQFKANPSLAFPKSELAEVYLKETRHGVKAYMVLNFMTLFGSASPLPTHYSEEVLSSIDTDKVLVDFLDMFNHHLQKFVYPIWEKQRYYIQYQRDLGDKFSKYMLSILGLYSQSQIKTSKLNFLKLMPYIGLLSMRQKSAATMVSIIRHYLSHDAIDLDQCIPTQVIIDPSQYALLGTENCQLGGDLLLGESVKSHSGKFRILISDIAWDELYSFSVLGPKIQELKELVTFALNEPLEYDVCLYVKKEQMRSCSLEEERPFYLGINTWIGEPSHNEKFYFNNKEKNENRT